jgi:hypothetical protein
VTGAPTAVVYGGTLVLAVATDPSATLSCALDGGPMTPCGPTVGYTGLPAGPHQIAVQATDPATGATTSTTVSFVAADVPAVTIANKPPGVRISPTQSLSVTPVPGATSYECAVDGAGWLPCGATHTFVLTTGTHVVQMRALIGSVPGPADAATVVIVDPAVTTGGTPPLISPSKKETFTFTAAAGLGFVCSANGALFAPCSNPYEFRQQGPGIASFAVRAVDDTGFAGPTYTYVWTIV